MADPKSASKQYNQGSDKGRKLDTGIAEKNHQRAYNPIDEAERGNVSEKLNGDSGKQRYKVSSDA